MIRVEASALPGLPEVRAGDDLAALLQEGLARLPGAPAPGDVLVIAHKVVSKAEGAVRDLADVRPGARARRLAAEHHKDPRLFQVVLDESAAVLRAENGRIICRTHHGFVCANAGVDASNAGRPGQVTVLPRDPDGAARALRARIGTAIVISDSFGRPWRWGIVDVALGVAGFHPLDDQRGRPDTAGRVMRSTIVAVADEIASAAELASGKTSGRPVVLVRGASLPPGEGSVRSDVVMPPEADLFR